MKKKSADRNKYYFYLTSVAVLALLLGSVVTIWLFSWGKNGDSRDSNAYNPPVAQENNFKPEEDIEKVSHPLTGEMVLKDSFGWPVAIMIDNVKYSRPQAGLEKAGIIYEALVEGGITRYLGIFDSFNLPSKIGPVRSARPYFIDFAEEYKGIFIHAGGSPSALSQLSSANVYDLDGIRKEEYFWRDQSREAPYNLYISNTSINHFIEKQNIPKNFSSFSSWKFSQDKKNWPFHGPVVKIGFQEEVTWIYQKENGFYRRQDNGLKAKNLIILETDTRTVDEIGRLFIRTQGKGPALFFQQGRVSGGQWEKKDGRTRFYDYKGSEISLIPGPTWIEIISPDTVVTY